VKVVAGHNRGLIMDLGKGAYYFCPLTLCDFVHTHNKKRIADIMASYDEAESGTVQAYIDWLLGHQLAVVSDHADFVNKVIDQAQEWDSPYPVTNCIVEVNESTLSIVDLIIGKIDRHRIPHLELRVFDSFDLEGLYSLLSKVQESDIKTASVVCRYHQELKAVQLRKKLKFLTVIESITVFSAPFTKTAYIHDGITAVSYLQNSISNKCCGNITPATFRANRMLFSESVHFNTCLNRKISIGTDGAIKNCPSMPTTFGNIVADEIGPITASSEFKKWWTISKDQISVCRDCEFRHVCTDCRAYLQNPADVYSKPLKCGYNPYTNEWEEWSTNPLSKAAIEYYGLDEIAF
jgi:SPASM domain peptide maturase of grasp-with-spasm system